MLLLGDLLAGLMTRASMLVTESSAPRMHAELTAQRGSLPPSLLLSHVSKSK